MNTIDKSNEELRSMIARIVTETVAQNSPDTAGLRKKSDLLVIPAGVSNRHVHLCREDMDILFGEGSEMTPMKELSQKGFYAAKETVVIAGPKGAISGVRLLGPLRSHTQVELLASDTRTLGVSPEIRESGTLAESPMITIIGPKGTVLNNSGSMIAWRHIHMNTAEAKLLGLRDGDYVKVETMGDRSIVFDNVKIRLGDFDTELHLDIDEANAANLKNGDKVRILL